MAPLRVLQLSDLHAGTQEKPEVEGDLRALVESVSPELVVVSGDLTHQNRAQEHDRAARLLRSLTAPLLVVPGNHDIPKLPPWRFTHTFDQFERVWEQTEPTYRSDRLVVCGLNSVRPWKQQGGALRSAQLELARRCFDEAAEGALRVAVLHHHLLGAPWRTVKRTIANRSSVLGGLVDAGAELILSGHVHQSAVAERREFEVAHSGTRGAVVVTCPGLGQPRPKRRGEARGLHLYEAEPGSLSVLTYAWAGSRWEQIAHRRFPRGREPLATVG
jgi:3',5'-cyclic AMP phosphodiesterase CpdA